MITTRQRAEHREAASPSTSSGAGACGSVPKPPEKLCKPGNAEHNNGSCPDGGLESAAVDVVVLMMELLLIPATNLSGTLYARAGCNVDKDSVGEEGAAVAAALSGGAPRLRPALFIDSFDDRVVRDFPCRAGALGRNSYMLRRLYPFHLATVAVMDPSAALYTSALIASLAVAVARLLTLLVLRLRRGEAPGAGHSGLRGAALQTGPPCPCCVGGLRRLTVVRHATFSASCGVLDATR
ncbi:hypothetical protein GPECTOR_10g817 [Gonium pectorale]|uniref:Uncharacterized protein n=1 Tax=Gonium pectorale TaxID=33097 RepID=A0A150GQV8_GONPE|nr:hypothetical protein GPECTOR_10g817 [Gonium pectorale]|eukprot:KXZ52187.1 hypothetical protein GPECTOR_10g817 [Gonium pectorale]